MKIFTIKKFVLDFLYITLFTYVVVI